MLYIIKAWYGMPPSLPVVFSFLCFFALGIYAATAIENKKLRLSVPIGTALLYLACSPVSVYDVFGVGVYSTFLGGVATLVFAGSLLGLVIRKVKKK